MGHRLHGFKVQDVKVFPMLPGGSTASPSGTDPEHERFLNVDVQQRRPIGV